MEKILLLIERTFNGLQVEHMSKAMNVNELEKNGILYDERVEINQIAPRTDAYSLLNLQTAKVYSYINNSVTDVEGRNGFYAIRLMVGQDYYVPHVSTYLQKIATAFQSYLNDQQLQLQDYTDILNEISANLLKSNNIYCKEDIDSTVYYQFLNLPADIDNQLNSAELCLAGKVYFLSDKVQANEPYIAPYKLKPLLEYRRGILKIEVDNSNKQLGSLKINKQHMGSAPSLHNFNVFCRHTDKVAYTKIFDHKRLLDLNENTLRINPPAPIAPVPVPTKPEEKSSFAIIFSLLGLIIGGALVYFLQPIIFKKEPTQTVEFSDPKQDLPQPNFHVDTSESFNLKATAIKDYIFKYEPKKGYWQYKKEQLSWMKLTKSSLLEILNGDSTALEGPIKELQQFAPHIVIKEDNVVSVKKNNDLSKEKLNPDEVKSNSSISKKTSEVGINIPQKNIPEKADPAKN